jgi:hypothetical protein
MIGAQGTHIACFRMSVRIAVVSTLFLLLGAAYARSADQDLQLWMPVQVIHRVNEKWAVSMQVELRLQDNISEFSELVLKPALHYHLNPSWEFSVGYKYIDKNKDEQDEQDPWQEVGYKRAFKNLATG